MINRDSQVQKTKNEMDSNVCDLNQNEILTLDKIPSVLK